MPLSINAFRWSDCSEPVLRVFQQHATRKAATPIDWESCLQIDEPLGGFDIPYRLGDVLDVVLRVWCGDVHAANVCFVPYTYNYMLSPTYPAPREFWLDYVTPEGWKDPLLIVEAAWVHTSWRGTSDDAYREMAEGYAQQFNERYDQIKEQDPLPFNDIYDYAYHYIEVCLIQLLDAAIPAQLPVATSS